MRGGTVPATSVPPLLRGSDAKGFARKIVSHANQMTGGCQR